MCWRKLTIAAALIVAAGAGIGDVRSGEGTALAYQVAAGLSDFRLGRRRGQRAVDRARAPAAPCSSAPGTPGIVYALRDDNKDGKADEVITVVSGLQHRRTASPSATARCTSPRSTASCASTTSSAKLEDPPGSRRRHRQTSAATGITAGSSSASGPTASCTSPVGAPCNICDRGDPYAAITRMKPDGTGMEIFARGVRNTVGFDWHPDDAASCGSPTTAATSWATTRRRRAEPGRRKPGCTSAIPYCHERRHRRPEFGAEAPVQRVRAAGAALGAACRPRSACASTRARIFPRRTATRSSSPSTARGIARRSASRLIA